MNLVIGVWNGDSVGQRTAKGVRGEGAIHPDLTFGARACIPESSSRNHEVRSSRQLRQIWVLYGFLYGFDRSE